MSLDGDHREDPVAVSGIVYKLYGDVSSGGQVGKVGTLPANVQTNQGQVVSHKLKSL